MDEYGVRRIGSVEYDPEKKWYYVLSEGRRYYFYNRTDSYNMVESFALKQNGEEKLVSFKESILPTI